MYPYENKPLFKKILKKLYKKNKITYERVMAKIQEIVNSENVEYYKNLRHDLKNFKRVQIGEKVLIFKFEKNQNLISFEDLDHHDKIYFKRYD